MLNRARVHLVETFTYTFRQPYHTAKEMEAGEASAFIAQVRAKARELAIEAIRKLHATLKEGGYELRHGARCWLPEAPAGIGENLGFARADSLRRKGNYSARA